MQVHVIMYSDGDILNALLRKAILNLPLQPKHEKIGYYREPRIRYKLQINVIQKLADP